MKLQPTHPPTQSTKENRAEIFECIENMCRQAEYLASGKDRAHLNGLEFPGCDGSGKKDREREQS